MPDRRRFFHGMIEHNCETALWALTSDVSHARRIYVNSLQALWHYAARALCRGLPDMAELAAFSMEALEHYGGIAFNGALHLGQKKPWQWRGRHG